MLGTIHVVNLHTEDCTSKENYYYIGKSKQGNPLANPFTFNGKKACKAKLSFKTREEAVDAYRQYFHTVYGQPGFRELTNKFNEIYSHYKNGEDVYLGCFCAPLPCHGDVLKEELQKKLIRETIAQRKIENS